MKFKKSFTLIICTLLCTVFLLCSCEVNNSSPSSIESWITLNENYISAASVPFKAENADEYIIDSGKDISFGYYDYGYFLLVTVTDERVYADNIIDYTQNITTYIYDAQTYTEIFKHEGFKAVEGLILSSDSVEVKFISEGAFIAEVTVTENGADTYTATLYDASGKAVASTNDPEGLSYSVYSSDYVTIDQSIYRIQDGKASKIADTEFISEGLIDNIKAEHGKYLYKNVYGSAYNIVGISVLENYKVKHTYDIPSYAKNMKWFVLNDGNVFIQYSVLLDPDSTTYDYEKLDSTGLDYAKYDLVSIIWDIETNRATETELSFIVNSMYPKTDMESPYYGKSASTINSNSLITYSELVENHAYINYIKDKRIDDNRTGSSVFVDNGMHIQFNMSEIDENQKEGTGPDILGKDMYGILLNSGEQWVINSQGIKLYQLPASTRIIRKNYVVSDNHIYSVQENGLTSVLDMKKNNYTIEDYTENVLILKQQNNGETASSYYTFDLTAPLSSPVQLAYTEQGEAFNITYCSSTCFVVEETKYNDLVLDTKYTLYNTNGEALASSVNTFSIEENSNSLLIASTVNADGNTVIHVFKK